MDEMKIILEKIHISFYENEENKDNIRKLCYLLGKMYSLINWKRYFPKKFRGTFFRNAIKISTNSKNIKEMIEKISNKLLINPVSISSELIEELDEKSKFYLRLIRKESIYFTIKAREISNLIFLNKKKNSEKKNE